jgi:hypothetical protein
MLVFKQLFTFLKRAVPLGLNEANTQVQFNTESEQSLYTQGDWHDDEN